MDYQNGVNQSPTKLSQSRSKMRVLLLVRLRKSLRTVVVLVRLDLGQEKILYNLAILPSLR